MDRSRLQPTTFYQPTCASLQAARRTVAELGSGLAPLFGGYLANTFNPGVPFLVYAPFLVVSATLLAVLGKETLESDPRDSIA